MVLWCLTHLATFTMLGLYFSMLLSRAFMVLPVPTTSFVKSRHVQYGSLHSIMPFILAELSLINRMHIHFKCQPAGVKTGRRITYGFMGISFWKLEAILVNKFCS